MRKIVISIMMVLCCLPTFAIQTKASENIETYADAKEWKYKIIDGTLYKRLYNVSKKAWEGSWIKVN